MAQSRLMDVESGCGINLEAKLKGINVVPYFIINKEVIIGASSKKRMKNVMLRALNKKEEKEEIKVKEEHSEGFYCNEIECKLNKK